MYTQAFGTSSAFSDRLCIATEGAFNDLLSPEEIAFCCHSCGFGCHGGYPIKAWEYFRKHGLVTGGNFKSNEVRESRACLKFYLEVLTSWQTQWNNSQFSFKKKK